MNTTDIDAPFEDAGTGMSAATSKATARRLRHTRQKLGSYRHDLLVAMRIVNSIEKEMIQSEWENWLMNENFRCDQVKLMLTEGKEQPGDQPSKKGGSSGSSGGTAQKVIRPVDEKRTESLQKWHEEYCGSCHEDQEQLDRLSSRRSMTGL